MRSIRALRNENLYKISIVKLNANSNAKFCKIYAKINAKHCAVNAQLNKEFFQIYAKLNTKSSKINANIWAQLCMIYTYKSKVILDLQLEMQIKVRSTLI